MSKLKLSADIKGVDKTIRAIRRGATNGMEDAAGRLLEKGEGAAKDRIYQKRRIWNKEVYQYGWHQRIYRASPTKVEARLSNYAKHARVVDEGRAPGKRAPQAQDIIEWVDDKIAGGWTLDGDGGGSPPPDDESSPILEDDSSIVEVITGAEEGLGGSANEGDIRVVRYGDGSRGIFKPNEVSRSANGVVQNEEVFYNIADSLGWTDDTGFPISKQRTITDIDDTEVTGNIQQFIENSVPMGDRVHSSWSSGEIRPEAFGETNMDFSARTGVLDYVISNDDRHDGNILLDPDNVPWAIDSGGHSLPTMEVDARRQSRLLILDAWTSFNRKDVNGDFVIEDPERMHAVGNAILDRQEEIFQQLQDNPSLRDELREMAESLHESGTEWTGHYDTIFGDGPDSIFTPGDNTGEMPVWQYDIENVRRWLDELLEDRPDTDFTAPQPDTSIPWQSETEDYTDSVADNQAVDDILDDVFGSL